MSFFGRAANLIKGGVKSIGRPSGEADARARALEQELAKLERRPAAKPSADPAPAPKPEPLPERGPPERDENGEIKRTL